MKKIILLSFLFSAFVSVNAQEWLVDIEEAKNEATQKNRNIILVFQGGDWCGPCIKLEKNIWTSDEFKNYAKDHFVMLKANFPRKRKNKLDKDQQEKNNQLAEKYNKKGFFPHIVVLNNKGKVLGRAGYKNMNSKEYIQLLSSF